MSKRETDKVNYIEYLDKNNFSAKYTHGLWTMQHFHTKNTLTQLLKKYFHKVKYITGEDKSRLIFECSNPIKLSQDKISKAINTKFNIEYPNNYHHNKHQKLCELILNYS